MAVITENTHNTVWIALKRLDLNDGSIIALREVHIPSGAEVATVTQILAHSFRLDTSQTTFKIRNNQGFLIPLNCNMPSNSKQKPNILEVARNYQHVSPKPRSIPMTVKTTRLQSIVKRIERLEELLPQVKLKRHEKMTKDIDLLNQKLVFLHKRMQMAESYCWEGVLRRAPLW